MALRIMLMGLVASMGFELPGAPEVSTWARSGRDLVYARLADPSGPVVEADRPQAEPADCRQADASETIVPPGIVDEEAAPADTAFLAASEAMAAGFMADSRAMRDERSPGEDIPSMFSNEPLPVGLPSGEELAGVVGPDGVGEATAGMEKRTTRAARVISAIRLTREAVRAWSELMQESPVEDSPAL